MAKLSEQIEAAGAEMARAMDECFGSRDEAWRRVSEMAGLDENGNILPPPAGATIDKSVPLLWKTTSYGER